MPRLPDLPKLRASACAAWHDRMIHEHRASYVFESLADQLEDAGFTREEVATCRAFADEERRHGVLCGAVVEALGGEATADLSPAPAVPVHAEVTPREGALRNLVSVSCLSETVAVSLIGAERLEMPEGELRKLLTRILADEVGHARFGWTIVSREIPRLDDDARLRLGAYLAAAFGQLEACELAHLPKETRPPREGVALGLCDGGDARTLFYETVQEIIVPRLEALGVRAKQAWEARVPPAST